MQGLHAENYNTLMKGIKDRSAHEHELGYDWDVSSQQRSCRFNAMPIKIPAGFLRHADSKYKD